MATRRRYTKEQYAAAVPLQEKLIAELENQRPHCCSHEYLLWQPEMAVAEACLRGMKNPFRGRESLDSFSAHGGVNVDLYMDEFYDKGLLPKECQQEEQTETESEGLNGQ